MTMRTGFYGIQGYRSFHGYTPPQTHTPTPQPVNNPKVVSVSDILKAQGLNPTDVEAQRIIACGGIPCGA